MTATFILRGDYLTGNRPKRLFERSKRKIAVAT